MLDNSEKFDEEMIERVMRYCDGTLPPAEARLMADKIAADPALQQLADDLRLGASLAKEALAGIANDPVPLSLARAITRTPEPTAARPRHLFSYIPREAAAALVGLLIGAGAVGLYSVAGTEEAGLRLAGAPAVSDDELQSTAFKSKLMELLQSTGETRTVSYVDSERPDSRNELSVISWLTLKDGSPCAEFTVDQSSIGMASGIACRRADSRWDIMVSPVSQR